MVQYDNTQSLNQIWILHKTFDSYVLTNVAEIKQMSTSVIKLKKKSNEAQRVTCPQEAVGKNVALELSMKDVNGLWHWEKTSRPHKGNMNKYMKQEAKLLAEEKACLSDVQTGCPETHSADRLALNSETGLPLFPQS